MDEKGRIRLPSHFRKDDLKTTFFELFEHPTKACITGYRAPKENFYGEDMESLTSIFSYVVELDEEERVLIPQLSREHLELEKPMRVVFAGRGKFFEIWSIENWRRESLVYRKNTSDSFSRFLQNNL